MRKLLENKFIQKWIACTICIVIICLGFAILGLPLILAFIDWKFAFLYIPILGFIAAMEDS